MPVCKNDSRRYYTEKEPSPKGKGYCAHAEKVGCRKRGRDKRMWVVTKVANTKRWVPVKRAVKPTKKRKPKTPKRSTKKRTTKRKKLRGGDESFSNTIVNIRTLLGKSAIVHVNSNDKVADTLAQTDLGPIHKLVAHNELVYNSDNKNLTWGQLQTKVKAMGIDGLARIGYLTALSN